MSMGVRQVNNVSSAINNTVSISQFHKGMTAQIFTEVKKTGAKVVIRNNEPECVIMSTDDYMDLLDELAEIRMELTALRRIADGALNHTIPQQEVDGMFGFTQEDLAGYEEVELG